MSSADLEAAILGGILVAETEQQLRDVERKVAIEREQGLDVELLDAADLQRIAPYVSDAMVGGELCRSEGKANPLLAGPALARAAERHGARILPHTEVLGLEQVNGGFARTPARAPSTRRASSARAGSTRAHRLRCSAGRCRSRATRSRSASPSRSRRSCATSCTSPATC